MDNNLEKKNKLAALVKDALIGIQEEIIKDCEGFESIDGIQQLKFIQSKLKQIEISLDNNNLVNIEKPGIARLVIETWPINNSLGEKICQIEYNFEQLRKYLIKQEAHSVLKNQPNHY